MLRSSVILDIAIAAVLVLSVWIGGKKGLFRSLAELVIYLVGLVGASLAAGHLTDRAVELLRPVLESRVSQTVSGYLSGAIADGPLGGAVDGLEGLGDLAGDAAAEAAELLAETLLHDLTYVIVFLAVFLAAVFLLRLVIHVGDLVLRLPVLHEVNTLGGVLVGAVKGVLLVCLILWLDGKAGLLLDPAAVQGSYIAPFLLKILPA